MGEPEDDGVPDAPGGEGGHGARGYRSILGGMADTAAIAEALELVREGRGFDAHELLEDLWRAAPAAERDLYQGLVHVAVATYQESRGNEVGRSRQLEKAIRRLTPYAPCYEGIEIDEPARVVPASLAAGRCPDLP